MGEQLTQEIEEQVESYDDGFGLPMPFPETPEDIEETQWGDPDTPGRERTAKITERFDDGGFIVYFSPSGRRYRPIPDRRYYVPPGAPPARPWMGWVDFGGGYRRNMGERRAVIYGILNENTGFHPDGLESPSIPIEIATSSNKAVAAYLFARWEMSVGKIASKMDMAEQTVRQYLSDYKSRRTS